MKASPIKLSRHQSFQLYGWMEKNKSIAAHQTAEVLARTATKELGFPISTTSINQARNDLGIVAKTQGTGQKKNGKLAPIHEDIRFLSSELLNLLVKVGEPVPAKLEEMAK